ncbi:hypothetical protein AB0B28_02590 [Glycomyces sp. NPDC046736]|uniref:WXG100 family type VII secretion target n=1 Tax=Glycomyces sp. NPDC046736 TaxID=3155615 RepID=UPI0033EE1C98
MSDTSLIAEVESTRKPWTGSGIADSIEGLIIAIESEGWVDDALAGLGLVLEGAGAALDPFSALLSNGLGWAIEFFEPLREILDWLTGKVDVVASHATTWRNMAAELFSIAEDLNGRLGNDLSEWTGDASEAYQEKMTNNVDAIGGLGAIALAMASATEGAGGLVEIVREVVREIIADLVAKVIVWAIEAALVVTIPVVAAGIIGAVVEWVGTIMSYVMLLLSSIQNLAKLIDF